MKFYTILTNSVALVRERTLQTERPPLVGEVSASLFEENLQVALETLKVGIYT
jgi:hypothetical protein